MDVVFGNGENTYHLILELYSGGNLILTNYEFEILALLRSYKMADGSEVDVNQYYHYEPSMVLIVSLYLIEQHPPFEEIEKLSVSALKEHFTLFFSRWEDLKPKEQSLKYILLNNHLFSVLGSVFVHNVLSSLQLTSLSAEETKAFIQEDHFTDLLSAIQKQASSLQASLQHPHGYIVANEADIIEDGKIVCKDYQDFAPFEVSPSDSAMKIHPIPSFNDCIDQYFINDENYRVYLNFQK